MLLFEFEDAVRASAEGEGASIWGTVGLQRQRVLACIVKRDSWIHAQRDAAVPNFRDEGVGARPTRTPNEGSLRSRKSVCCGARRTRTFQARTRCVPRLGWGGEACIRMRRNKSDFIGQLQKRSAMGNRGKAPNQLRRTLLYPRSHGARRIFPAIWLAAMRKNRELHNNLCGLLPPCQWPPGDRSRNNGTGLWIPVPRGCSIEAPEADDSASGCWQ